MMTKTAYYMQMAQEAAAQITGSKEQWTAFLTTSARMEQMMAELLKANPAPDKKSNQMAWVQHMNMLEAQNAAEIEKTKAEAEASANRTVAASITDGLIRMKEAEAREKHGWITVQGADTVVTNGDSN